MNEMPWQLTWRWIPPWVSDTKQTWWSNYISYHNAILLLETTQTYYTLPIHKGRILSSVFCSCFSLEGEKFSTNIGSMMLNNLNFNFIIFKFYLFIFDSVCKIHEYLSIWPLNKHKLFSIFNYYAADFF